MIRATLDANVLAPGFTSQGSASWQIIARWRAREFALVQSMHLVEEFARTLEDSYFAARATPEEALRFVEELRTVAILVDLTVDVRGVATHPEDDLVLSTAISGRADILCTRDRQLLKLRTFESTAILGPGEFLAFLETLSSE